MVPNLYERGRDLVPTCVGGGENDLMPTSMGEEEIWCPSVWEGRNLVPTCTGEEEIWCPPVWVGVRIGAHLYDLLHEELVGGHLGLLHDGDVAAHPRQEDELGPFGHLVSCLNKKGKFRKK